MKKITATVLGLLSASNLCAQSLFDLAPTDDLSESLPLTWTVGASLGYDDNATPIGNDDNSSLYGVVFVGASFVSESPQTRIEFAAEVGYVHYFDDLDFTDFAGRTQSVDQSAPTANLSLNWTRRVNERLRLSSRNSAGLEFQPDYSLGFTAPLQTGRYYRWSSDNAIGYRWTERLATYTGVIFDGVSFEEDEFEGADVSGITLYNDFRYQLSPQTVATLTYRYAERDTDRTLGDSQNHFILAGLEHRFSPNTVGIIRAGAQIRSVDGVSGSTTTPSVEAALNSQVNSQFRIRSYARYSVEDFSRRLVDNVGNASTYSNTDTLRVGITGTYQVSQPLSITAGVNYQLLQYNEGLLNASDVDEDLINAFVGFNLQVAENVYVNGSYNFEDLGSDLSGRDYNRNRFSVGVTATF